MPWYTVTIRAQVEQDVVVRAASKAEAKRLLADARDRGEGPQAAGDLGEPEWRDWWVAWDVPAEADRWR